MTRSDGMPFLIKVIAKFAFSSPAVGAHKVFEGFVNFKGILGAFIEKEKIRTTKFSAMSGTILDKIDHIYREEYLREAL